MSSGDRNFIGWMPSLIQYYLISLAAIFLPTLGVLLYVGVELRDMYRDSINRQLETKAQSLAVAVERAIQRHIGALEAFAASPEFDTQLTDIGVARLYQHASRTAKLLGTNVVLIKPDMGQVFNTLAPLGSNLPKTGGVAVAQRTFDTAAPQISNLVYGKVAQRYAVGVVVPVRDGSDQIVMVVAAPFDPALLSQVLTLGMHGDDAFAALVDAENRILARSENHEEFVGEEALDWWRKATAGRERGHAVGPNLQGRDVLVSFVRVPVAPHWTLAVSLPVSVYLGYWLKPLTTLLVGLVGTILLGAGLSVLLARRVQLPLTEIARTSLARARAITDGNTLVGRSELELSAPVREIRQLIDSMATFEVEVARRDRDQRHLVAKLETALADRNVLLGEVYHRVKNNLQQIISLIYLRSGKSNTLETKEALAFVADRVHALARVHHLLLQRSEHSNIDAVDLLTTLSEGLSDAYDFAARRLSIKVAGDGARLSPDNAIVIGLIATELIDNAQRHGFDGRKEGEIGVSYRLREGMAVLQISDNGVGGAVTSDSSAGLGASIVAALADQLDGDVSYLSNTGGTTVAITFQASA